MYFDVGLVLLACTLFVLFRWKMCNILIPCKCSTGRLAHYQTFFMFYELGKYNYDKKMCNNMCSILYMYFLCITSCLMLKLEIHFGPPWFANFFELRFTIVVLKKMLLVGVSEYVVYGIAQHVNSHWVLFWEILFGFSNEYLNCIWKIIRAHVV